MAETKTMINLKARIEREKEKLENYKVEHSVHNAKSKFITCPSCGSQLNRSMFKTEKCPLCKTELRSKTTLDTLAGYDRNIKKWEKEYAELDKKHKEQVYKSKLIQYSFYEPLKETDTHRTVSKDDAMSFIKKTKKPFRYTYGLSYRNPSINKASISRKDAVDIFSRNSLTDITELDDYVFVHSYSTNDMW